MMYTEESDDGRLSNGSIDLCPFKLSGQVSPLNNEGFINLCKAKLKTNPKNSKLWQKAKKEQYTAGNKTPRLSQFNSEAMEEIMQNEIKAKKRYREAFVSDFESHSIDVAVKLDVDSCFMWFIVERKTIGNIIPDYEFNRSKEIFLQMLSKADDSHELHFGIAKLLAYENNFEQALRHLKKATEISDDKAYKIWYVVIYLRALKDPSINNAISSVELGNSWKWYNWFCCTSQRKAQSFHLIYRELLGILNKVNLSIENLWATMIIAQSKTLFEGLEIESPMYYASKIKEIDNYYGYLAWAEIYIQEKSFKKSIEILKELVKIYTNRPEAYMKLWQIYYYTIRDYGASEDIAAEAFIRLGGADNSQYHSLLWISYAKSFFKLRKYSNCFELLQQKYIENSSFPIFLYQYGRLCIKSEVYFFTSSAIGALQECLRLCDKGKYGSIYYWLSKGLLMNRQYIEALKAMKKALFFLNPREKKKADEVKRALGVLAPTMRAYELLINELSSEKINLKHCKLLCNEFQMFNVPLANIYMAKIMWLAGHKQQAIADLKKIIENNDSPLIAYFILLECLKESKDFEQMKEIGNEMIKFCNNAQITTLDWIKAHLLYSKTLIYNKLHSKAIFVLKCLAKVFPPMPYVELPYTKYLQKATTYEELNSFPKDNFEIEERIDIHSNFIPSYKTWNREIAVDFLDDEAAPKPIMSPPISKTKRKAIKHFSDQYGKRKTSRKFDGLSILIEEEKWSDEELEDAAEEKLNFMSKPKSEKEFAGFSISSNPIFLYKIAKYSAKYRTNIDDGLHAVDEFITLLKFEKDEDKKEKSYKKAIYWKSLLKSNKEIAKYDWN